MPKAKAKTPDIDAMIADLAKDMRAAVAKIESDKFPTTQNNYGRYLSIITVMAKGDATIGRIIAHALIVAGANRRGVLSAFSIVFGGTL